MTATVWEDAAAEVAAEILGADGRFMSFAAMDEELSSPCPDYAEIGAYALSVVWHNNDGGSADYMDGVLSTVIAKQTDYGHGNILRHGITGINVRMCDKVERIKHLQAKGGNAVNEPLADSWLDLVGYSIIAVMLLDGTFELPLRADVKAVAPSGEAFLPWEFA